MDRHKGSWILEFVLRQPIDDWLAKEILLRLPAPPILDPHLKKTIFLRRLSSDLSSDRTLHSLELLEELDRSLGAPEPHEALKAAYCAVAAHLTVAPLRTAGGCPADAEFLDAANRIWNCRVADLERSDARGLVGETLREWRREVEVAVADDTARGRLVQRDTKGEAEATVREYLRVALEDMGPPLLELVAGAVGREAGNGSGDGADLRAGSRVAAEPSGVSAERAASTRAATADLGRRAPARGILPVQERERLKGSEEAGQRKSHRKDMILEPHLLPIPEASVSAADIRNGMTGAPADPNDSGRRDAHVAGRSIEKDPQASATEGTVVEGQRGVEHVEMIQNTTAEPPANPIDPGHDQNQANIYMATPSIEKHAQATSTKGTAVEDQQGGEQRVKEPRISLMERNPTARTCQWDEDSNESLSEKSADSPKRPRLPTPRIQRVSPLTLYTDTKCVHRRKNKRWTPQEEDALREAVKKHGVGNWKFILQHSHGTFEDRTEVDLKDKWRNMSRILELGRAKSWMAQLAASMLMRLPGRIMQKALGGIEDHRSIFPFLF